MKRLLCDDLAVELVVALFAVRCFFIELISCDVGDSPSVLVKLMTLQTFFSYFHFAGIVAILELNVSIGFFLSLFA